MRKNAPVLTAHLLPGLLSELLDVLTSLTPKKWDLPTPCPGWSVHDLAAHLLGDDVGQLSMERDGFGAGLVAPDDWDGFVRAINDLNEQWVQAMRRVSPRLITDLLRSTGEQANGYLQSLDPNSIGPVVSWAGDEPAPTWLHVAREYTERWHHQQQIREAVGSPLLTESGWFAPVLATFAHGLPRSFSNLDAPTGTTVRITMTGPSGGVWLVTRTDAAWELCEDEPVSPVADVTIDEVDAWKMFTRSTGGESLASRVLIEGDQALGSRVLTTVSIIA